MTQLTKLYNTDYSVQHVVFIVLNIVVRKNSGNSFLPWQMIICEDSYEYSNFYTADCSSHAAFYCSEYYGKKELNGNSL